ESLRVFREHGRPVLAVAFSPDGAVVASASNQSMLFSPSTGELVAIPPGRGDRAIAFSPDGAQLIAAADSDLRMWDAGTGRELRVTRAHDRVLAAAFSPDGTRIATAGTDHLVRLWDAAGGGEVATLRGHRDAVSAIAFAPDGATLVSAGRDQVAIVWDLANGTERARLEHDDVLHAVAVSPDGARLATGSQSGVVTEWDVASGTRVRELRGGGSPILALDLSGDGRQLATGSLDGTVKSWDLARPREMRVFAAARDWVNDVGFSADGARLAVVSGMGPSTVQVWDVARASALRTIDRDEATRSIALSPEGGTVVVPGKTTELWDVDGGERTASLDNPLYVSGGIVAMNPAGTTLALTGAARVRWWQLPAAGVTGDAHEPDGEMLWSLAWSDDGALLAAGNNAGVVRLWDARSGAGRGSYPDQPKQVWSLQFSADGRRLASGGDTDVVIRELGRDGSPLVIRAHRDRVEAIRFARGGELVLTASRDETIAVHDARTGDLRATLFATAADGFVVIDAAGRIDGDAGADALIDWHVGDVILPGYVGWQRNHHPDLLRNILAELGSAAGDGPGEELGDR
ncbi:MAG TPA: WD40 repeat domain-containing protein, partial [Kofleriaceae bacterium]|nr:WD40 repeat domain-containing protein [Kofleriaceae bacterium]